MNHPDGVNTDEQEEEEQLPVDAGLCFGENQTTETAWQTNAAVASILGAIYAFVLAGSLVWGVRTLSPPEAPDTHYFLNALAWLAGTGVAARFAALLSKSSRVVVGVFTSLPVSLVWLTLIAESNLELPRIRPQWAAPSAFTFGTIFLVSGIVAGVIAGISAERISFEHAEEDSFTFALSKVRPRHWWWLWLPMSSWAGLLPTVGYLLWLAVAETWHWTIHPSLWFNPRWFLFLGFGMILTYLPIVTLRVGATAALFALAGRTNGAGCTHGTFSRMVAFVGWGFCCAVLATIVLSFLGFWVLSKLPLVGSNKPWFVFF